MENFHESTLFEIIQSTLDAFPETTKRQFAIQPIIIKKIDWAPFVGVKTLFVKGIAQSNGKEYFPMILFKQINYEPTESKVKIIVNDGRILNIQKINVNNEVSLRCNCFDFYFRFNYYNHLDKSLYGRKRKKYISKGIRGPVNPLQMPGVCKHLLKLIHALEHSNVLSLES